MANIRKTFNFRNGVQVDEDNLIVNSFGLVGIGTSVPTELLDVRGTAKIIGLVTATEVSGSFGTLGVATITSLRVGGNISINSGVITATTGVATFYGDGSGLINIPTSQWIDVDSGFGFTSIYAAGFVGVVTDMPYFPFQVGGSGNLSTFANGVGIGSEGNILATGIITATTFSGSLSGNVNGNINSGIGTFSNLNVGTVTINSGIVTATTFRGNLIGNVTGTASTAQNLTGTPSISVNNYNSTGILTTSTINSVFSTTGISTINTLLNIAALGSIGVGTNNPNANIHIRDANNGASIQLTSDNQNETYISIGASVNRTQNNGELRFGNTNVSQKYSTPISLDIINYGLGNINNYLHFGSITGINTGSFNWIYGKTANSPLMTLTYDGRLGLGVTNPDNNLEIVGTSTVTGNSFVGGSFFLTGNLTVGGIIFTGVGGIDLGGGQIFGNFTGNLTGNVNANSGISTFNQLSVTGNSSFTSVNLTAVGIGTNSSETYPLIMNGTGPENQVIIDALGNIGLGTNSFNYALGDQYRVSIDAARGTAYLGGISVGTTTPSCFADFSNAGFDIPDIGSIGQFMLPPKVTTTVRNSLSVVEGAFIYNTSNNRLEVYNGTGWCGIATVA